MTAYKDKMMGVGAGNSVTWSDEDGSLWDLFAYNCVISFNFIKSFFKEFV